MQSIKEIRLSTGLSQGKFCEMLNIPTRTVQDWEQGKRQCPAYVAELIAFRVENDPLFPKAKELTPAEVERQIKIGKLTKEQALELRQRYMDSIEYE